MWPLPRGQEQTFIHSKWGTKHGPNSSTQIQFGKPSRLLGLLTGAWRRGSLWKHGWFKGKSLPSWAWVTDNPAELDPKSSLSDQQEDSRGAPPVPLFISAFATSDWTHVSPVAFESLESCESCSSLQEGSFQFRENNYPKPMGAVMFEQWWLVGPGAQGRYQPSPARQGDGRRWQRKLEIQLLMKLHQLVQSEASGNRKRSTEGHRARAR